MRGHLRCAYTVLASPIDEKTRFTLMGELGPRLDVGMRITMNGHTCCIFMGQGLYTFVWSSVHGCDHNAHELKTLSTHPRHSKFTACICEVLCGLVI
jgi:hypothetical protein